MSLWDMMVMMFDRMVGSGVDATFHGHSVLHSVTSGVACLITVPNFMSALVSLWACWKRGSINGRVRIGAVVGGHAWSLVYNCISYRWMVVIMMTMVAMIAMDLDRGFLDYRLLLRLRFVDNNDLLLFTFSNNRLFWLIS